MSNHNAPPPPPPAYASSGEAWGKARPDQLEAIYFIPCLRPKRRAERHVLLLGIAARKMGLVTHKMEVARQKRMLSSEILTCFRDAENGI